MSDPVGVIVAIGVLISLTIYAYDRRAQIAANFDGSLQWYRRLPLVVRRLLGAVVCFGVAWWCAYGFLYPGPNPPPEMLMLYGFLGPTAFGGGIGCLRGRFVFDATVGFLAIVSVLITRAVAISILWRL